MFSFVKRHKVVSALLAVNLVAIAVVVGMAIYNGAKTATVDIYVAPSEATIELNGQKYDNFQSYDILPGEYHVKIAMEGMETREYDLSLGKDEFKRIRTYLLDEGGGFDYYLSHPEDEMILAEVVTDEDKEAKRFVEEYARVAAIEDILPIEFDAYVDNFAFYVNYEIVQSEREDCPKIVCLTILDRTGGNEDAAIELIRENGFNPDDYDISYEYDAMESVRAGDD